MILASTLQLSIEQLQTGANMSSSEIKQSLIKQISAESSLANARLLIEVPRPNRRPQHPS